MKLFKKKNKKISYPYHYIKIIYSETALHDGVLDDFNKIIVRVKGNEEFETPYTEADLKALVEVYKIPFIDLTKFEAKEFKFEKLDILDGTYLEVRR